LTLVNKKRTGTYLLPDNDGNEHHDTGVDAINDEVTVTLSLQSVS